ncbi:MAG: hypothetical protein AB8B48_13380 [Pseudomonadales bacterium]
MKQSHRKVHGLAWLLLLPLMIGFVYMAQNSKPPTAPAVSSAPAQSEQGELP